MRWAWAQSIVIVIVIVIVIIIVVRVCGLAAGQGRSGHCAVDRYHDHPACCGAVASEKEASSGARVALGSGGGG
jgi:hypothetical protein